MSVSSNTAKVVVIGGGISGLATCYFLGQRGIRTTLVEKSGRLGGLIQTDHIAGCDLEGGPDSFVAAKTAVAALAHELGISDRIIGSNDAARRIYIRKNGKLIPMPKGMSMMVPGDLKAAFLSPLFDLSTKLRFIKERRLMSPRERTGDVSIETFVSEHFGPAMVDALAEPLLSGVYGGDAGRLSAASVLPTFMQYEREYGSLIQGLQGSQKKHREGSLFLSFAGGMQTLTDALSEAIQPSTDVRFDTAHRVTREASGWNVDLGTTSLRAEEVVIAVPTHAAANILGDFSSLSANLEAIPYSSALAVMLVFDRATLGHPLDGFGVLIPRNERRHVAAATWVSTKFPTRTPDDRAALRAFIVGEAAERLMNESEAVLTKIARDEFQSLMGIEAEPLLGTVHRWPESMPQYMVGHQRICNTISALAAELPGLHICGNAYNGVGIPDCIQLARQVATKINAN